MWLRLVNLGLNEEMDFLERKKTQGINIAIIANIPFFLYFGIINLLNARYLLSVFNFALFAGGVLTYFIHLRGKFLLARSILILFSTSIFFSQALLYRNGNEQLLLVNIVAALIFYSKKKFILFVTILNALLYLYIKVDAFQKPLFEEVPQDKMIFNYACAMVSFIVAIQYFKYAQSTYQKIIEQKNAALAIANKTKEKLFSIVAHDLRAPVGQLKTTLDLVNKQHLSIEEFKQFSVHFSKEIEQLQSNMDNLLTWSQSQLNGISTNPKNLLISASIQEAIRLVKQAALSKSIEITHSASNELVHIDPEHLKLILRNLLTNAIKFSHENSTIHIHTVKNKRAIIVSIKDTGIGMGSFQLEKLFTHEEIISIQGTNKEKGTGLGLKLCKEFIHKNNGDIWVSSEVGMGSTFSFSIPLVP